MLFIPMVQINILRLRNMLGVNSNSGNESSHRLKLN